MNRSSGLLEAASELTVVASFHPLRLRRPGSWVGHLPFAYALMRGMKPSLLVELGTHTGNSYFTFCQAVLEGNLRTQCYAVDSWRGDEHAGLYSDEIFNDVASYNRDHYKAFSHLLRTSFNGARDQFKNGSIQLLHIDGLHTYEAVKHDFETWYPKVEDGGVILFHDISESRDDFGVWKLWDELKYTHAHWFQFQHSHGLGVILKGSEYPQNQFLAQLFNKESSNEFGSMFTILGKNLMRNFELQSRVWERDEFIRRLEDTVKWKEDEMKSLRASGSWKVTAPLRLMRDKASQCARVLASPYRGIQKFGGLRSGARFMLTNTSQCGVRVAIQRAREVLSRDGTSHSEISYSEWIHRHDRMTGTRRERLRRAATRLQSSPLISIVMPVHNTPVEFLRSAIESVRSQIYEHWELCIADDGSTDPQIKQMLDQYRLQDRRIKLVTRPNAGHICAASNSALGLASGEYIAFLDHDDLLSEHALYEVAAALNEAPNADIIYSDEDKITENGMRVEPHFKSDWNPDLFFGQNYLCHLCVVRRELVRKVDGFREGVEGSQDHDLVLRCLPFAAADRILHIPKILYHWRIHSKSTASEASSKTYTTEAGLKAVTDYFENHGARGVRVEKGLLANTYRMRWPIPEAKPLVSLLVPTREREDLVAKAVESLLRTSHYPAVEILILDNGSQSDSALAYFKSIQETNDRVRVLPYHGEFNFSAINNAGVAQARGEILGFINNDIEAISDGWLEEMASHALRPDIGCVGAKLLYPNGNIQHAGVILGVGGVAGHSHKHFPCTHPGYFSRLMLTQNVSAVTAACLLVRRTVFEEVGGFDEANLAVAFNDVDFCLKVRQAGYRNLWTPYAEFVHHESVSRGPENDASKIARFQSETQYMLSKWAPLLTKDPYYNPNLTLEHEGFTLATVSRASI